MVHEPPLRPLTKPGHGLSRGHIHEASRSRAGLADSSYAVVLPGGRGSSLGPLTERRGKLAVPFAGKLKIIDFTLSNCVKTACCCPTSVRAAACD